MVVDWSRDAGPERESWDVGFREDDEVGFASCGFLNEADGLLDGFCCVEEYGRDVAGCVWWSQSWSERVLDVGITLYLQLAPSGVIDSCLSLIDI